MKKYDSIFGDELRKQLDAIVTVSSPSHSQKSERGQRAMGEKPYQDHRPKEETQRLIKNCIQSGPEEGLSAIALARCLGRKASPHFRSIIAEMVESRDLIESNDIAPNGRMVRYLYSLPR